MLCSFFFGVIVHGHARILDAQQLLERPMGLYIDNQAAVDIHYFSFLV